MVWVCDNCGYENEYTDKTKDAICLCCREKAFKIKPRGVRKILPEYHDELLSKAYEERVRHIHEHHKRIWNTLFLNIPRLIKAMVVVQLLMIIVSIKLSTVLFPIMGIPLSEWYQRGDSNIKLFAELKDPDRFEGSLDELISDILQVQTIKSEGNHIVNTSWELIFNIYFSIFIISSIISILSSILYYIGIFYNSDFLLHFTNNGCDDSIKFFWIFSGGFNIIFFLFVLRLPMEDLLTGYSNLSKVSAIFGMLWICFSSFSIFNTIIIGYLGITKGWQEERKMIWMHWIYSVIIGVIFIVSASFLKI